MKTDNITQSAFFALLRSGLWEKGTALPPDAPIDFSALYKLAEEQSVTGLVAAGLQLSHYSGMPEDIASKLADEVRHMSVRNRMMNYFISVIVEQMRQNGIRPLLLKGQGIAQCYEKPKLRASGDIDLLLQGGDYEKAKKLLMPMAESVEQEAASVKHLGLSISPWLVELHGSIRSTLSRRIDREMDAIQACMFSGTGSRVWDTGANEVQLPSPDEDIVYVFVHILQHYYRGGIGLRQLCDWSRLVWTYRDGIDRTLLESRLKSMRLDVEWRAFAAFAVELLGMPAEAMPLYEPKPSLKRKADRIKSFIMEVGNFGYNRDMSYYSSRPFLVRKLISFGQRVADLCRHARTFPLGALRFFPFIVFNGLRSAAHGEG